MVFIVKKDIVKKVNGDTQEIHVDIDSRRKNKEVQASFIKDGEKYSMEDPLTKFIQKISKNHNSIFELLEKEKKESFQKMESPVYDLQKVPKRGKRDKGISKKIFEYDLPAKNTRKKKRKKHSKKKPLKKIAIVKTEQLLKK